LPRPVVLVGKLTGATELSDDTGRVSVEIIGLDAGMLDAYVCLPAFRLAFDPAAGLCVVAAIRDVVVHSPLAALEQQQAIPPAQEIKKEAAHGFVVMVPYTTITTGPAQRRWLTPRDVTFGRCSTDWSTSPTPA
jgi:hypothetical protein